MPLPAACRRAALLGAAGLAVPGLARAQAWPARPVRILVPFPPGGSNDVIARILQPRLAAQLGVAVQVENRAGGLGSTAAIEAMRAPADGQTWLLSFDSEATNATLLDLPYRVLEDFIPAGRIGIGPVVIGASASRPWRDLADLAVTARAAPVEFATAGSGGIPHLAMLTVAEALGLRLVQTSYRGGAAALEDVTAGFVPLIASNLPVMGGPIRAGTLRPLAVTTREQSRHLPGVRSLAEQGVPGFDSGTWWMLLGRSAAPEAARSRMAQALASVLAEPEVRRRIEEQGVEVAPLAPPAAQAFLAAEVARWATMIRRFGVRA
jgi:tripartite-type tricarboxylate transporter receptor subunit TctC